MLIDSHCHLDFPELAADQRAGVLARAKPRPAWGAMITISTSSGASTMCIKAIAEAQMTTSGSPSALIRIRRMKSRTRRVERLVDLASHPRCVGIGEAGLDYHYDKSPRDIAERVFRTFISPRRETTGLPLVIHSRDADADMARILRDEMGKGLSRLYSTASPRAENWQWPGSSLA